MTHEPLSTTSFDERLDALAAISYRVAFRMTGSREDARDLVQEALARAYARWSKVNPYAEAWVSTVTTNLALDQLRKRRPSRAAHDPHALDGADAAVERADLVAALRRLPARQREVVVLRFLADLSEADVAAALGCSTGTVKQHAHRALTSLRASLHLAPSVHAIDRALEASS